MPKSKSKIISREITHEEAEACASEQVQFISCVQPHGFLIVVDKKNNKIIQYSRNLFTLLNAKKVLVPNDLKVLDTHLHDWVNTSDLNIDEYLRENRLSLVEFAQGGYVSPKDWECLIASYKSYYTLEFIPKMNVSQHYKLISDLSDSLNYIEDCDSEIILFDKITEVFQRITKYDRVMMYKFYPDWSGEVISESVSKNNSKKYLGLRFPSEDIPRSAR